MRGDLIGGWTFGTTGGGSMKTVASDVQPEPAGPAARALHVIVNPMSGNGWTRRYWSRIDQRLRSQGYAVDYRYTECPGDGARLGREAVASGVAEIVVVGGDGTLNEVVNGILSGPAQPPDDLIVSLLPCGSGRDFSRSLGIRSFEHAVEVLANGEVIEVDVGRIHFTRDGSETTCYFVNAADVGIGAETVARLKGSSKRLGGFLTYLIGAASTIIAFRGRPVTVRVDGEQVHDGPAAMVALANGRFHAAGMRLAPMARLQDGMLDILILQDVPKWKLLGSLLPRVYFGWHIGHPAVSHRRGRKVEVTASDPQWFETDGEQPGTTDLRAEVVPGALRVRVPAGYERLEPR
jgi:diacylglycerol kinase (ATP)